MKKWVLLLVGLIVVLGASGCLSGEKPYESNILPPINITGTVYKIEDDGFFMNTDFLVHPKFVENLKREKAFIMVFPFDNTSISNLNLTIGSRVRVIDAVVACKARENETTGCAPSYKEDVLVLKSRSTIVER